MITHHFICRIKSQFCKGILKAILATAINIRKGTFHLEATIKAPPARVSNGGKAYVAICNQPPGLKPRITVNKIPTKEGMKSNSNSFTTQFSYSILVLSCQR